MHDFVFAGFSFSFFSVFIGKRRSGLLFEIEKSNKNSSEYTMGHKNYMMATRSQWKIQSTRCAVHDEAVVLDSTHIRTHTQHSHDIHLRSQNKYKCCEEKCSNAINNEQNRAKNEKEKKMQNKDDKNQLTLWYVGP